MPIYVFQCRRCDVRTEAFFRTINVGRSVPCESCGSDEVDRVFTPFAIYRSELTQLQQLDPKYRRRVDEAMAHTADADPMRHLSKMTSFNSTDDPGDPIKF